MFGFVKRGVMCLVYVISVLFVFVPPRTFAAENDSAGNGFAGSSEVPMTSEIEAGATPSAFEHSHTTTATAWLEKEYDFRGVRLLEVPGNTYFVSLDGDDNNSGTFEQPFYSWQKAAEVSQPGDITYIRGGVWQPTSYIGFSSIIGLAINPHSYGHSVSGTAERPIRYYNYPGEHPVLDGSLMEPSSTRWLVGINLDQVEHIYMRGLTVCNIHQVPPDPTHVKVYSEVYGIGSTDCANLYFENMIVHDVDGRAYQHWSGAWNEWDGADAPYTSDTTTWINCDAYNIYDRYAEEPGNAADGWKAHGYQFNKFIWRGCRAWNYADDGFDPSGECHRVFDHCWAMSSHKYEGLSPDWNIEGNGFKVTAPNTLYYYPELLDDPILARYINCVAADCVGSAFANNLFFDGVNNLNNNAIFYNNFTYLNYISFHDMGQMGYERTSVFKNNISYASYNNDYQMDPPPTYEPAIYNPSIYEESNNSWIATQEPNGWPGWEYNPAVTVTDDDFVSLDLNELTWSRKADGSLPDINFGNLRDGSDLIDAGIDVGLPYFGAAPDMGAFEYTPEITRAALGPYE